MCKLWAHMATKKVINPKEESNDGTINYCEVDGCYKSARKTVTRWKT